MPAYITGTGVITAIGNNTGECIAALKEGRNAIAKPGLLDTHWKNEIPVAEIGLTNEQLADIAGAATSWPRTSSAAARASGNCS